MRFYSEVSEKITVSGYSADMVVIFECGQFRMVLAEKYYEYQTNVGYYDINCFAKEVIGNIHDNLELLKRG